VVLPTSTNVDTQTPPGTNVLFLLVCVTTRTEGSSVGLKGKHLSPNHNCYVGEMVSTARACISCEKLRVYGHSPRFEILFWRFTLWYQQVQKELLVPTCIAVGCECTSIMAYLLITYMDNDCQSRILTNPPVYSGLVNCKIMCH